MKKLFLSVLLAAGLYLDTFCQDILVLKNGDEIKAKVLEVLPDAVKYKKWENQDGPLYSESKANIFMIKYQNGTKDVFKNNEQGNTNIGGNSNSSSANIKLLQENAEGAIKFLLSTKSVNSIPGTFGCRFNLQSILKFHTISQYAEREATLEVDFSCNTGAVLPFKFIFQKNVDNQWILTKIDPNGDFSNGTMQSVVEPNQEINIQAQPKNYTNPISESNNINSTTNNNNISAQKQIPIAVTPSEIASLKPAFTGLIWLDTAQAIISIVFNSIEDEIGKEFEIKNKILELLKTFKRIKEISAVGIDTANIPIRYRLECNTKTFYNSSYSSFSKANVYTADLRLSLYLWEINKSGKIVKGTPSDNIVIKTKSLLGGAYISKQGAFDAVLPNIQKYFYLLLAAYFPISGEITEITDANNKGEPKKVKISCGINQGIFKEYKFDIKDPQRKAELYDLDVVEVFENYSICKVKNNESIIAERMKSNNKIVVITSYVPLSK